MPLASLSTCIYPSPAYCLIKNTMTKSDLGGKRLFQFTTLESCAITNRSQGRNLEELQQSPRRGAASSLLPHGLLSLLAYSIQEHQPRQPHPVSLPLLLHTSTTRHLTSFPTVQSGGSLSNENPLSEDSSLYQTVWGREIDNNINK